MPRIGDIVIIIYFHWYARGSCRFIYFTIGAAGTAAKNSCVRGVAGLGELCRTFTQATGWPLRFVRDLKPGVDYFGPLRVPGGR